jgi:hypothetical protein
MKRFQHSADNLIIIVNEDKTYIDTVDNFKIDLGESYNSEITEPNNQRYYEPEKAHWVSDGSNAKPQELNWERGEYCISQIDRLIGAKQQREEPI